MVRISCEAIYRDGAFHPLEPVDIADGTHVWLRIESREAPVQQDSTGADLNKHLGVTKSGGE